MAIPTTQIIEVALREYRKANAKLALPYYERQPSASNTLRPSSLGLCPLKAAFDKHNVEPDFPDKTIQSDAGASWITSHGNYVAPMIQEPLMWFAMTSEKIAFQPELPVAGEWRGFKVSGRIDGYLSHHLESCVVEIKNSEGKAARSKGEPQLRYVWQTLLYMQLLNVQQGAIVIANKWGYDVWDLLPQGERYVLSSKGVPYTPPYGVNWNEKITLEALEQELRLFERYNELVGRVKQEASISGYDNLYGTIKPPIEDPLNHPLGWLCVKQWERPTAKWMVGWSLPARSQGSATVSLISGIILSSKIRR